MLSEFFSDLDHKKSNSKSKIEILQVIELLLFKNALVGLRHPHIRYPASEARLVEPENREVEILALLVIRCQAAARLAIGHRGRAAIHLVDPPWAGDSPIGTLPKDAVSEILGERFQWDQQNEELRFRPRATPYELSTDWLSVEMRGPRDLEVQDSTPPPPANATQDSWLPYSALEVRFPAKGHFLLAAKLHVSGESHRRLVGEAGQFSTDGPDLVLKCIEHIDLMEQGSEDWAKHFELLRGGKLVPQQYEIAVAKPSLGAAPVEVFMRNGSVVRSPTNGGRQWADVYVTTTPGNFSLGLRFPSYCAVSP